MMKPIANKWQTGSTAASDELLLKAAEHMKAGRYEEAMQPLIMLREADPRHELAIGMLGAVYAQLHAMESAIACFEQVLDLNPDNFLARFHLGLARLDEAQPRAALQAWQPCLEAPGEYIAHYHCGLAWMKLDLVKQARDMFMQAARFMPANHPLHSELQQMLLLIGMPS